MNKEVLTQETLVKVEELLKEIRETLERVDFSKDAEENNAARTIGRASALTTIALVELKVRKTLIEEEQVS